jgi:hypothetical protein
MPSVREDEFSIEDIGLMRKIVLEAAGEQLWITE